MKSIILATQSIRAGDRSVVVAGGMEKPLFGKFEVRDSMENDGLWDVYNNFAMGNCGESAGEKFRITRESQDAHAIESYKRAERAWKAGAFDAEIAPITIKGKKGDTIFKEDEEYKRVIYEKVPSLKSAFKQGGSITAANSSNLNDGASALILMSAEKAKELGIKPLAKVISYADAGVEPIDFPIAPTVALPIALQKANLTVDDISLFEINEAFSVVIRIAEKVLGVDPAKVNVNGGAVALGHAIGNSGSRIIYGAAGICNGVPLNTTLGGSRRNAEAGHDDLLLPQNPTAKPHTLDLYVLSYGYFEVGETPAMYIAVLAQSCGLKPCSIGSSFYDFTERYFEGGQGDKKHDKHQVNPNIVLPYAASPIISSSSSSGSNVDSRKARKRYTDSLRSKALINAKHRFETLFPVSTLLEAGETGASEPAGSSSRSERREVRSGTLLQDKPAQRRQLKREADACLHTAYRAVGDELRVLFGPSGSLLDTMDMGTCTILPEKGQPNKLIGVRIPGVWEGARGHAWHNGPIMAWCVRLDGYVGALLQIGKGIRSPGQGVAGRG
ncbi:erg10, acetyl-CoA C-acetyltransferase [Salix suchowensis]|nr:erg10, acetyl-CoA C-acetyltransferase [Salix suchowensis]